MIRSLLLAVAVAVAAPVFVASTSTSAFAISEKKLEAMKEDADYHKDRFKEIEKLANSVIKDLEKDKKDDADETHKELKKFYKDELAGLRAKGIETVDEDIPETPLHVDNEPEEIPREKLEELRDLCVDLKNQKPSEKPKPYQTRLEEYLKTLQERYERKESRYEEEKAASK